MKTSFMLFIVLFFAFLVLTMPLLAIWSINTLFNTEIEYEVKTWFASLILCGIVGNSGVSWWNK